MPDSMNFEACAYVLKTPVAAFAYPKLVSYGLLVVSLKLIVPIGAIPCVMFCAFQLWLNPTPALMVWRPRRCVTLPARSHVWLMLNHPGYWGVFGVLPDRVP